MDYTETSRYLSLILRHKPEVIGITLDEHGWAEVDALIKGISKTHEFIVNVKINLTFTINNLINIALHIR